MMHWHSFEPTKILFSILFAKMGNFSDSPFSVIEDFMIDRLIGTARGNKVSAALGFREFAQLEADYGKVGIQKIKDIFDKKNAK